MSDCKTTYVIHPCRGSRFKGEYGIIKVIAVADGWAMVRQPFQTPFCVHVNILMTEYRLIHPAPRKRVSDA